MSCRDVLIIEVLLRFKSPHAQQQLSTLPCSYEAIMASHLEVYTLMLWRPNTQPVNESAVAGLIQYGWRVLQCQD